MNEIELIENKQVEELYLALENKIRSYNSSVNFQRIRAAFELARDAHSGTYRKDGSPYITHPLAAAQITAEMGLDEESIIACLLHDCIEDTDVTHEDIEKQFGDFVADIVEGVTKLTRVVYTSKEEEQMENLRKMLMAMAKDIRVILIKIADRLHNMRTMNYQSELKQKEKALETMEIYAPIAHRLGMQKIKWELEDLSIMYLDPIACNDINRDLENIHDKLDDFMDRIQERISNRLHYSGLECTVYGRRKHLYSIYRKMYTQGKEINEVFDLCAFRVIVNTVSDCYNVLGQIHDLFKPMPGRFKDYISTPKPNMYQSLHTTVIGSEGIPFEVQIRTWEMHETAEYGVAAHWKYKQGIEGKVHDEEKFAWIRRLLEAQQDTDAQDFFHDLKIDMFGDEVFVFTPKGDVVNLPADSTPIDFAYSIHSAIGNRMTGAKVNNKMVPFDYALQNGDVVEIITGSNAKGPSRDWINIVKSNEARVKIKQWFKRERREENILHGRSSFEAEIRHSPLPAGALDEEYLSVILKKMAFSSMDDLYAAIGYGGISAVKAANRIRDEFSRLTKVNRDFPQRPVFSDISHPAEKIPHSTQGVIVEGIESCLVKFSRCCTPVPGDDIVGFITRGYGVSVHRADCSNYIESVSKEDSAGRWVSVSWSEIQTKSYQTSLVIEVIDRNGLLMDIAAIFTALKIKISSLSTRDVGTGNGIIYISIEVNSLDELKLAMARVSSIRSVLNVKRANE